jgi:hypothetical protein
MLTIKNKRIPRYGKEIRRFVNWLNKKHPIDSDVTVIIDNGTTLSEEILDQYNAAGEGDFYGLFCEISMTILIPVGGVDCTLCLEHLAHELYHAFQFVAGMKYRENDADAWCVRIMLDYQGGF